MEIQNRVGSVTGWVEDLKNEDPEAQRKIWERFVDQLVRLANRKLKGGCRLVDGEDIANMAFANFFEQGPQQFERLMDRNDLWQILSLLVQRRAIDEIRKESALKNGGGILIGESVIRYRHDRKPEGMDQFAAQTTPADFDVMLIEETEKRLASLNDETLRRVAIDKMQGYQNRDIAERLQLSLRSVERKISEIRAIFSAELS